MQPKTSDRAEGSDVDSFKSLADEFSVLEKTSPAIDANLAAIVTNLLTEKLAVVQNKYTYLVPKINKQIWQQLRQMTRSNDSAFQKAQSNNNNNNNNNVINKQII